VHEIGGRHPGSDTHHEVEVAATFAHNSGEAACRRRLASDKKQERGSVEITRGD
jgi:hypothetical protein